MNEKYKFNWTEKTINCRLIRDYQAENEKQKIEGIIESLSRDFIFSVNNNSKKGGLIGLAASAIALGIVIFLFQTYYKNWGDLNDLILGF